MDTSQTGATLNSQTLSSRFAQVRSGKIPASAASSCPAPGARYQFLWVTSAQIFMIVQYASRTSAFGGLFEEETFGQKCLCDALDVLRRYTAGVEVVSPSSHSRYDFVDFYSGRLDAEPEALGLRKQVVDARR